MIVLNVGASDKALGIPTRYDGWEHKTLDVDPRWEPDILLDAREMKTLPGESYDAIYSGHFLEHIHRHELGGVLEGFLHVLKPGGECSIKVPDIQAVAEQMVTHGLDIQDTAYRVMGGKVTFLDMIYGYGKDIAKNIEFMCHRNGFTQLSLGETLFRAGFGHVEVARNHESFELFALAHKKA